MNELKFRSIAGMYLELVMPFGIDNRTKDEKELCENLKTGKWVLICVFPKSIPFDIVQSVAYSMATIVDPTKLYFHSNHETISILYKGILDRRSKRNILKRILSLKVI
jgi:hypothetical protein